MLSSYTLSVLFLSVSLPACLSLSLCHFCLSLCLSVLSSIFLSVYLSLSLSHSFTISFSHLASPTSSLLVFTRNDVVFNLDIFLNLNDLEPSDSCKGCKKFRIVINIVQERVIFIW